jgi:hypothetical protein
MAARDIARRFSVSRTRRANERGEPYSAKSVRAMLAQ